MVARDDQIEFWKLDDGKHHEMRLTNYRPQNKSQGQALAAAMALAKHWDTRMTGSLWLWSDVYGVGKTHLTYGLLWVAVNQGYSIAVWDEVTLLGQIRETYSEGNGSVWTEEKLLAKASDVDLLAWDDMGRGSVKPVSMPWYQAIVYKVLNARFDRDKPILVTSNMAPRMLQNHIGGAAYSRLRGLCPVEFRIEGEDFRARS